MKNEELFKIAKERIFQGLLDSTEKDYIDLALLLKDMKPNGW